MKTQRKYKNVHQIAAAKNNHDAWVGETPPHQKWLMWGFGILGLFFLIAWGAGLFSPREGLQRRKEMRPNKKQMDDDE